MNQFATNLTDSVGISLDIVADKPLSFALYSPRISSCMAEDKSKNALLIAASLIAAVRLAREEIRPSPKVVATISDSIRLAEMIQERIEQRTPTSYSRRI
jgi:hypothetical protein